MADKNKEQQMVSFIQNDDVKGINSLIDSGFNLETTLLNSNMTSLMFAVANNSLKSVETLIKLGANINAKDKTIINIDEKKLDKKTLDIFKKSNFDGKICEGLSVLELSILNNHNTIANMLIDSGADISYKRNVLMNPLIAAAVVDNVEIAKKILFSSGYITEKRIIHSLTLPAMAIKNNSIHFLEFYLKNVRITGNEFVSLFLRAMEDNSYSCLSILLGNCDFTEPLLNHLLAYACIDNKLPYLEICKKFDVDFNKMFLQEMTPLSMACFSEKQNQEVILKLIEYGANINITDKYGMSPLMYAACKKKNNIVELLIKKGASTSLINKAGKTYKYYLENYDKRSWGELYRDRNKDKIQELFNNRENEIPAQYQTFNDKFEWYLQKYFEHYPNAKTSDIYNSCFMDRKLFSKLRSGKIKTNPNKDTVISLALGLKLTLKESEDLMHSAGYYFSEKDKIDIEIMKLLSAQNYNGFEWSAQIYQKTKIIFFKSLKD